jgi:Flp pilus assembly CpaF family ATPase
MDPLIYSVTDKYLATRVAAKMLNPEEEKVKAKAVEAFKALREHSQFMKARQGDIKKINAQLKQINSEVNSNVEKTNKVTREFIKEVLQFNPSMGPISDWEISDVWINPDALIVIDSDMEGWPYADVSDSTNAIRDVLKDMKNP